VLRARCAAGSVAVDSERQPEGHEREREHAGENGSPAGELRAGAGSERVAPCEPLS